MTAPILTLFLLGSAFFVWVSWHALRKPRSHGFTRFIAWECMLALHAVQLLRRIGQPSAARPDAELLPFEKTSTLVTSGAFRYIRHPMYAALPFLAWGAFLKDVSLPSVVLVSVTSIALLLTALRDEAECRQYFGAAYAAYMQTSKRFIPFVF